jgi:hypothetical protein
MLERHELDVMSRTEKLAVIFIDINVKAGVGVDR